MILSSSIEIPNGTPNIVLKIVINRFISHSQPILISLNLDNWIAGLDFSPNGELAATIDCLGVCLISDVNTDSCHFHVDMGDEGQENFGFYNFQLHYSSMTRHISS